MNLLLLQVSMPDMDKLIEEGSKLTPNTEAVFGYIVMLLLFFLGVFIYLYIAQKMYTRKLSEKSLDLAHLVTKIQIRLEDQKELPAKISQMLIILEQLERQNDKK
jgi:hypothetical protein